MTYNVFTRYLHAWCLQGTYKVSLTWQWCYFQNCVSRSSARCLWYNIMFVLFDLYATIHNQKKTHLITDRVSTCKFQPFVTFMIRKDNMMIFLWIQRVLWYCSANNKRIKKFCNRSKANNMRDMLIFSHFFWYCSLFSIILFISKANTTRNEQY